MNSHFLSSEIKNASFSDGAFHVISAPLEQTVSYGAGTSLGPGTIIGASDQLEVWDGKSVPCDMGIHTKEPIPNGPSMEFLKTLEASVADTLNNSSIPVVTGGEHTVTLGAARAVYAVMGRDVGIIQFDAHADLREKYGNDPLSHACVMRRVHEETGWKVLQVGIRSESQEEAAYRKKSKITCISGRTAVEERLMSINLPDDFPSSVYITFDVDCFDGSEFPATGTPVPGGLTWYQVLGMIESVARARRILGFDVVEFAPREGLHFCDAAAAQLVYNIMGIIQRSPFSPFRKK